MAFPCAVIFAIIKDALTIPFNSALAHKEEMLREKPKLASGCISLTMQNTAYPEAHSICYHPCFSGRKCIYFLKFLL